MTMSAPLTVLCLALCLSTGLSMESLKAADGYEVFPAYPWSRFKMPSVLLTWADALAACDSDGEGSHLVVINSDQEVEVVMELLARAPGNGYPWVGMNDIAIEGQWVTVLGGLVSASGYNKWYIGQPDEGTKANCGGVRFDSFYYDAPCYQVRSFICERPNV